MAAAAIATVVTGNPRIVALCECLRVGESLVELLLCRATRVDVVGGAEDWLGGSSARVRFLATNVVLVLDKC